MAKKAPRGGVARSLVVLFVLLLSARELAAASSRCKMDEKGLMACLPSMTKGASPAKARPSPDCCAALRKADLPCLCKFKNDPSLPQLGIDPKLAAKLPAKCRLRVPQNC